MLLTPLYDINNGILVSFLTGRMAFYLSCLLKRPLYTNRQVVWCHTWKKYLNIGYSIESQHLLADDIWNSRLYLRNLEASWKWHLGDAILSSWWRYFQSTVVWSIMNSFLFLFIYLVNPHINADLLAAGKIPKYSCYLEVYN